MSIHVRFEKETYFVFQPIFMAPFNLECANSLEEKHTALFCAWAMPRTVDKTNMRLPSRPFGMTIRYFKLGSYGSCPGKNMACPHA